MARKRGFKYQKISKEKRLLLKHIIKEHAQTKYGIGIECTKCKKWRKVLEYEEAHEVPDDWNCSMTLINGQPGSCDLPTKDKESDFLEEDYVPGTLVWAKYSRFPWWPAMVEEGIEGDVLDYHMMNTRNQEEYHVVFFEDNPKSVWITADRIRHYRENEEVSATNPTISQAMRDRLLKSINEANNASKLKLHERVAKYGFSARPSKKEKIGSKKYDSPAVSVELHNTAASIINIENEVSPNQLHEVPSDNGLQELFADTYDHMITYSRMEKSIEIPERIRKKTLEELFSDVDSDDEFV